MVTKFSSTSWEKIQILPPSRDSEPSYAMCLESGFFNRGSEALKPLCPRRHGSMTLSSIQATAMTSHFPQYGSKSRTYQTRLQSGVLVLFSHSENLLFSFHNFQCIYFWKLALKKPDRPPEVTLLHSENLRQNSTLLYEDCFTMS